jgi:hypothetical protein
MMTISSGPTSADVRGTFDPTKKNFFCRDCRSYVQAPRGEDGMRACPTPGCTNPTGFGVHWKTPRPKAAPRLPIR